MFRFVCSASLVALVALVSIVSAGPLSLSAQEGTPAAADGTPAVADCPVLTDEERETLARTQMEAWFSEDPSLLEGVLSDDFTHHWSYGYEVSGFEAFIESVTAFFDAFEFNRSFSIEQVVVGDDAAAVRWTGTGTQIEEHQGFPASEQPFTFSGIVMMSFSCGKIVESWSEIDQLGRLQQQGTIPGLEATPEE